MLSYLVLLLLDVDAFFLLIVACSVLIRQELLGMLSSVVFLFTTLIVVLKGIFTMREHRLVCMGVHGRWFLEGVGGNRSVTIDSLRLI